ncbi:MAG: NUDIX domain-containing protein [Gammaproteobacteria bacterium]|nr:NUDIX domain-containing protein [Gammaproteobacteria bacterium]
MAYTYDHPHPAVTVDVVLFTIRDDDLKALLIQRAQEPFEGSWALPGGFVGIGESLRRAAWRELREETGVHAGYIEQLHTFGRPGRDPRERVITVAYLALLPSDAAKLFSLKNLPDLAFDHANILRRGHERLKEKLDDSVIALQLLPAAFTHSELRRVYELVLGVTLDKRNFRKKISALDVIEATGEEKRAGPHRPAKLYRAKNPHDVPFR